MASASSISHHRHSKDGQQIKLIVNVCLLTRQLSYPAAPFAVSAEGEKKSFASTQFQADFPSCLVAQSPFEKIKRSDVFRAGFMAIYSAAD